MPQKKEKKFTLPSIEESEAYFDTDWQYLKVFLIESLLIAGSLSAFATLTNISNYETHLPGSLVVLVCISVITAMGAPHAERVRQGVINWKNSDKVPERRPSVDDQLQLYTEIIDDIIVELKRVAATLASEAHVRKNFKDLELEQALEVCEAKKAESILKIHELQQKYERRLKELGITDKNEAGFLKKFHLRLLNLTASPALYDDHYQVSSRATLLKSDKVEVASLINVVVEERKAYLQQVEKFLLEAEHLVTLYQQSQTHESQKARKFLSDSFVEQRAKFAQLLSANKTRSLTSYDAEGVSGYQPLSYAALYPDFVYGLDHNNDIDQDVKVLRRYIRHLQKIHDSLTGDEEKKKKREQADLGELSGQMVDALIHDWQVLTETANLYVNRGGFQSEYYREMYMDKKRKYIGRVDEIMKFAPSRAALELHPNIACGINEDTSLEDDVPLLGEYFDVLIELKKPDMNEREAAASRHLSDEDDTTFEDVFEEEDQDKKENRS